MRTTDSSTVRAGSGVAREIVEDLLPSLLLQFGRVHVFGIEGLGDDNGIPIDFEGDDRFTAVFHGVFDALTGLDEIVGSFEIEGFGTVAGGHGEGEVSARLQVVRSGGAMPGGVSEIPAHDVVGGCPAGPGVGCRNVDAGLYGDHDRCVNWSSKVATKTDVNREGTKGRSLRDFVPSQLTISIRASRQWG